MSLVSLSVKHGRTLDDARTHLEMAVNEAQARFGPMIQRIDWSADRNSARLLGPGYEVQLRVDPQEVHVTADVPVLGNLLGAPLIKGLKRIVQQTFQKRLP